MGGGRGSPSPGGPDGRWKLCGGGCSQSCYSCARARIPALAHVFARSRRSARANTHTHTHIVKDVGFSSKGRHVGRPDVQSGLLMMPRDCQPHARTYTHACTLTHTHTRLQPSQGPILVWFQFAAICHHQSAVGVSSCRSASWCDVCLRCCGFARH